MTWPAGIRRYSYRKKPELPAGNSPNHDNVQIAFNVLPAGDKGKITKAKSDISTIEGALEMYRLQMNSYPTTSQGLQALVTAPAGVNAAEYQRGQRPRSAFAAP